MLKIRQVCPCHGEIELGGNDTQVILDLYEKWRKRHTACVSRSQRTPISTLRPEQPESSPPDWREKYLSHVCSICGRVLTVRSEITTTDSRPMHITCKVCQLCNQKRGPLNWYGSTLAHPACQRKESQRAKDAIEATQHPIAEGDTIVLTNEEDIGTGVGPCWICTRTDQHQHGPIPDLSAYPTTVPPSDHPKPVSIINIGPGEYHVREDREPGQRDS